MNKLFAGTEWWDEFRGRCVSCRHSLRNGKKLICQNEAQHMRGTHGRLCGAGGAVCWTGDEVHELYGCVFHESAKPKE